MAPRSIVVTALLSLCNSAESFAPPSSSTSIRNVHRIFYEKDDIVSYEDDDDDDGTTLVYSNINELPYDSSLRALEAYHRKHGDLVIPNNFIVPATNGEIVYSFLCVHIMNDIAISNLYLIYDMLYFLFYISLCTPKIICTRISSGMARYQACTIHIYNEMVEETYPTTSRPCKSTEQTWFRLGKVTITMEYIHRCIGMLPYDTWTCDGPCYLHCTTR